MALSASSFKKKKKLFFSGTRHGAPWTSMENLAGWLEAEEKNRCPTPRAAGRHKPRREREKRCPPVGAHPLLTRGGKRSTGLEEWPQPAPSLRTQTQRRSSPQLGGEGWREGPEGEGRNLTLPRSLCSGLSARLSG